MMIEAIVIVGLIVLIVLVLTRGRSSHNTVPEQIKIDGLQDALASLRAGKTEFDFVGITSNGIDCIYFIPVGENFNLEFEAIVKEQVPYLDKLEMFAKSSGFNSVRTTYDNKPQYESDKPAPVIRLEMDYPIDKMAKFGERVQNEVFENDQKTIYEVVP